MEHYHRVALLFITAPRPPKKKQPPPQDKWECGGQFEDQTLDLSTRREGSQYLKSFKLNADLELLNQQILVAWLAVLVNFTHWTAMLIMVEVSIPINSVSVDLRPRSRAHQSREGHLTPTWNPSLHRKSIGSCRIRD